MQRKPHPDVLILPFTLPEEAQIDRLVADPDRITAVQASGLLDSPIEESFDALTRLTVRLLKVPASFVSVVDANRDFYKSQTGFPRQLAQDRQIEGRTFCHFSLSSAQPLVIEDTHSAPQWLSVPTVASLGVRAYVGVPLRLDGQTIGSFCVIDSEPHHWTADELEILQELGKSAEREIALRAALKAAQGLTLELSQVNRQLEQEHAELEQRVSSRTAELSQARSEAEQASRAKSEFLASMSHEIRTPMSGVLGLLELLGLGDLNDDQRATLSLANDSGVALIQIIDDILDLSKIEANRLTLVPVPASVKAVVEKVCRLHVQLASRKDLVMHAQVSTQISPLLWFDPLRLSQILNNFLSNAIKFTEQGSVEVSVNLVTRRAGHEQLCFQVRDTGTGMTPEQLDRLFRPFTQATAQISSTFGGTGLGLVISRRMAEMMGGTVDIQSQLGKGTILTLMLELAVCDAPAQTQTPRDGETLAALMAGRRPAPAVAQAESEGTLLLVVDDHPTNRRLLLRQLASLGYAAEAASDGEEALMAWQSGRFAAVITDCNMPRMNGYDLAKQIRDQEQREGHRRTLIFACTANALQSARDLCTAAGMDDCLIKPADLTRVSKLLDHWLPLPRGKPTSGQTVIATAANSQLATWGDSDLDMVLLATISGGDKMVQKQILADFRQVNELDANALRQSVKSGHFAQVAQVAHRIQGASLTLGATVLAQSCARVEAAAAASIRDEVLVAMDSFEGALLRLNTFLDAFIASLVMERGGPSLSRDGPI